MNGKFNAGTSGFEVYVDGSASASYVVDSQSEDNALDLDIKNTGDAEWKIQVKQGSVTLEEDQWYTLSFDIRSSMARSIQYAIQRDGSVHKDVMVRKTGHHMYRKRLSWMHPQRIIQR